MKDRQKETQEERERQSDFYLRYRITKVRSDSKVRLKEREERENK